MAKGKEKKKETTPTTKLLTRRYSAGGLVFKAQRGRISWLLINPKDSTRWQFPKGNLEIGEKSEEAAVREVEEEGGVVASVLQKLGNQSYFYYLEGSRIFQHVVFFLMRYEKDSGKGYDKKEIGEAVFLLYEKALDKLTFENDKKLLQKAMEIVESGLQENLI